MKAFFATLTKRRVETPTERLAWLIIVASVPAGILGLQGGSLAEGVPADICLFDPDESWRYDARNGFSKSGNSPWHGKILRGRVKSTIVGGRVVFDGVAIP